MGITRRDWTEWEGQKASQESVWGIAGEIMGSRQPQVGGFLISEEDWVGLSEWVDKEKWSYFYLSPFGAKRIGNGEFDFCVLHEYPRSKEDPERTRVVVFLPRFLRRAAPVMAESGKTVPTFMPPVEELIERFPKVVSLAAVQLLKSWMKRQK